MPARLIYPYPPPETIGLELALDHKARVRAVAPRSVAAQAGIRAGDDLLSLEGQPLLSIADVSWVLHHAPDDGSLAALVQRGTERTELTVALPADWRNRSDISRRVGTWAMRAMALGGLQLIDLANDDRTRRGLSNHQLALLAKHVGQYGEHAAAQNAGVRKDDILVEVAGITERRTEGELIGELLRKYQPGDSVSVTVLRGTERIELRLPMQ